MVYEKTPFLVSPCSVHHPAPGEGGGDENYGFCLAEKDLVSGHEVGFRPLREDEKSAPAGTLLVGFFVFSLIEKNRGGFIRLNHINDLLEANISHS